MYRKIKVSAAYQSKSVSEFIRDLLREAGQMRQPKEARLPLGKYRLKGRPTLRRRQVYETYLGGKVSR